jgi:hypothetical protein
MFSDPEDFFALIQSLKADQLTPTLLETVMPILSDINPESIGCKSRPVQMLAATILGLYKEAMNGRENAEPQPLKVRPTRMPIPSPKILFGDATTLSLNVKMSKEGI